MKLAKALLSLEWKCVMRSGLSKNCEPILSAVPVSFTNKSGCSTVWYLGMSGQSYNVMHLWHLYNDTEHILLCIDAGPSLEWSVCVGRWGGVRWGWCDHDIPPNCCRVRKFEFKTRRKNKKKIKYFSRAKSNLRIYSTCFGLVNDIVWSVLLRK